MIGDLNDIDRARFERLHDVCIVGAGPAGITLARRLAGAGLDVVLMEGGGEEITAESQELYEGEVVGQDYYPLDVTRLRCLGGSSNHWAGICRAFDAVDFEPQPFHPRSGWPIAKSDLDPYAAETDDILELPAAAEAPDPGATESPDLVQIVFRDSRPATRFGEKYRSELAGAETLLLCLNANLVDMRLNEAHSRVEAAVFRSHDPEAAPIEVRARAFALCLGGIENPRALLNARSQMPAGIGNDRDLVGRFFCEHPHVTVGEIELERAVYERQYFAPTARMMTGRAVLNFGLRFQPNTERLSLVRETMRSIACTTDFTTRLAERIYGGGFNCRIGGLGAYLERHFGNPDLSGTLRIASEQALNPESRVRLDDATDRFGLARAALDWRLSEIDFHTIREAGLAFGAMIADSGLGRLRIADWLLEERVQMPPIGVEQVGGHHHLCATRMAEDPQFGVVDRDCRVFGIANLYLGGSSVFATAGHANPTYTIVQLALRLGDTLPERLAAL